MSGKSSLKSAELNFKTENLLPIFAWSECIEQYKNIDRCMNVVFPVNGEHDLLLLTAIEGENSVFEGYFKHDPDVQATVVVNDDTPLKNKLTVQGFIRIC